MDYLFEKRQGRLAVAGLEATDVHGTRADELAKLRLSQPCLFTIFSKGMGHHAGHNTRQASGVKMPCGKIMLASSYRCGNVHCWQALAKGATLSDLFSFLAETEGGYRRADPETSIAAALERLGGKATDRKAALLEHYRAPAGLTDFELAARMHRQQTSAGKRRGELRDLGLVEATIGRRPAPSGSAAIVWVITDAGRTVIEKLKHGH